MTVKELIEVLRHFNPDYPVLDYDGDEIDCVNTNDNEKWVTISHLPVCMIV